MITKNINGILRPEHLAMGFRLKEIADDFLYLYLGTGIVAKFTQYTNAEKIRETADDYARVIRAFQTTDCFGELASDYCRNEGWREPA